MGRMILDLGNGRVEVMETPDTVDEIDICPELEKLGAWASDSLNSLSQRQSIVKRLEDENWRVNDVTQPLFDQLETDLEKYKGKSFGNKPMDFYDWIKLPSVRAQLPANTFDVIKESPEAVIEAAMLRRTRLQNEKKASIDADKKKGITTVDISGSDHEIEGLAGLGRADVKGMHPVLGLRSGLGLTSSILRLGLEKSDSAPDTKGLSDENVNPEVSVAVSHDKPSDDMDTENQLKP